MKDAKIRIVFKDNLFMGDCGYDHTIECDHYMLNKEKNILILIENGVECFYPLSSILFFEDLSNLLR